MLPGIPENRDENNFNINDIDFQIMILAKQDADRTGHASTSDTAVQNHYLEVYTRE